jgi:CHAT domain-containing protein
LSCFNPQPEKAITQLLNEALTEAQTLGDKRAQSYALGYLGHLYEMTALENMAKAKAYQSEKELWELASRHTQKALLLAQDVGALDITYQWQWQLGRILSAQDREKDAIATYSGAIETLKAIRSDLLAVAQDVQFSFRDDIEPVYRELLGLLLPLNPEIDNIENLRRAFYYIESLQVAELENFFRCGLQNAGIKTVNVASPERDPQKATETLMKQINEFLNNNPKTALIYPIIVKDPTSNQKRLAVITKLPKQDLNYHSTSNNEAIDETINKARLTLESSGNADLSSDKLEHLQKLYRWLLPLEESFRNKIETLVFIPDSSLRSISMAALHDGKQYLVDKDYAISVTPSIQLLKTRTSRPSHLNALIAGAEVERKGFDSLSFQTQISGVKKALEPKASEGSLEVFGKPKILNQFKKEEFAVAIQSSSYNLIHLATHGQFNENLQTTFILTGDKPEEKQDIRQFSFTISDLAEWIRVRNQRNTNPIELFVLSACQTATGSNRLILGLAGIAVKSGANATLAPLWSINLDSAPYFMEYFYEELAANREINKALAVQKAQRRLKEDFKAPYHWAAYVLIGK